jgi:hypothetical protein
MYSAWNIILMEPNEINWVFRNRILSDREETIYVDYVAADDGKHFDHRLSSG